MNNSVRRSGAHAPLATTLGWRVALPAAIACGVCLPALAQAALSGPVTGWESGVPSYISMYEYVPAKLAASPPVLVAAHYCTGSASAMYSYTGMPAIVAAADKYGFIMIFPQTTNPATSKQCWDVGSKASLTHDGGGDTQAIAQMVKYEITKRNADPSRVYIMGASSGAMLTQAMLAVYPDVFKAGAAFSGVPAGCWSAGWTAASNWGGTCANGQYTQTAQQWGDLVRGMFPGYTGFRPRVQLWHGTADATIKYANQTEAIKEWTNVLGLSTTPTSKTTSGTFTIEKWQNSCGFTVLEARTEANGGHTTPIDANAVISFFGLDKTGPDPQVAACGSGGNGGGSGGNGGSGGSSGSGGNGGGGGRSGSGGNSGSGGGVDAGIPGSGGTIVTGSGGSAMGVDAGGSIDDNGSGCSCELSAGSGSAPALAALGLAAIGMVLGRRARRRR